MEATTEDAEYTERGSKRREKGASGKKGLNRREAETAEKRRDLAQEKLGGGIGKSQTLPG
jgi:hypothetical protein